MNARSLFVTVLAVAVIAVGAPVAGQQSDGGKIALLIGNANYPDADAPLKQPVTDARAVADELRRNGFETDVTENLTKEAMQRATQRSHGPTARSGRARRCCSSSADMGFRPAARATSFRSTRRSGRKRKCGATGSASTQCWPS